MKRPALLIGLCYIAGLVIASKTDILSCGVMILTAIGIILYRRSVWKYVVFSTLSCLIACCSYWHHAEQTENRQKEWIGKEIIFTGEVKERTVYSGGSADYILKGEIDGYPAKIEIFREEDEFAYGDIVTIKGKPEKIVSDYLFNREEYAKAKNLFLCFEQYSEMEIQEVKHAEKQTLSGMIYNWREQVTENIQNHMPEDTAAMLTGMLFGDKTALRHSVKTALYRTGIGHILAVSGLHLDFLAMCLGWILEKIKAGRKLSFCLTGMLCGIFVICASGTISVKRACIMVLLSQSAKIFFRRTNAFNSLAVAMLLLGIENPFVIHSSSFWLSCSGAFGVGVVAQYMTKEIFSTLWKNFFTGVWTFITVLPASVLFFGEISFISPITNLFLTPICLLSILSGVGAVCFGGNGAIAEIFLYVANQLNQIVLTISDNIAGMPWTNFSTDSELLFGMITAGIIFIISMQIYNQNKKMTTISVAVVLCITGLALNWEKISQEEELKIAVLGEETQCLLAVRYGEEAVLFDITGNYYAPDYAESYLKGVKKLKGLYEGNPKDKLFRRYQEYLAFLPPEEVWLMKETEFPMPNIAVNGMNTAEEKELLFHGAKIEVKPKQIRIEYAGKVYFCKNDQTKIEETPDILVIYGTSKQIQPECGILIILDENSSYVADEHTYLKENNLEVAMTKDGKCRTRRLE